ncbi:hypothetical protein SAY86_017343 [Trapa natans]|uniref:Pentatricopeptide repeat-containing protein n=1 Tax=Trapa natans TaxID=22666 RepID=A0AAN7R2L9_TRANT|nr:hypothetical protein SAY86_017343 [Trapa natans]
MLLRHRWFLLLRSQRSVLLSKSLSSLIRKVSPVPESIVLENYHFNRWRRFTLSPRAVRSTLSNCPSDLIALRFFLWCAGQKNYCHDRDAFHFMASVLGRLTDRYTTVSGVLSELESVGYVVKAYAFLILMRIYWVGGFYEHVLETFEQMGRFGFFRSTFACNMVMDVLFKIGRADLAIHFLSQMQVGQYHQAITLFNSAMTKNYELDAVSYTVAIHGLLLDGRSSEASALFHKMKEIGLYPNVHTYNVMLSWFCKEKDVKMVVRLLEEMINGRIPLRHESFVRVINFLSRSSYGKSVSCLLVEARDLQLSSNATTPFFQRFPEGIYTDDASLQILSYKFYVEVPRNIVGYEEHPCGFYILTGVQHYVLVPSLPSGSASMPT